MYFEYSWEDSKILNTPTEIASILKIVQNVLGVRQADANIDESHLLINQEITDITNSSELYDILRK